MKPLVCFLTDFGASDEYAASMKGVLLTGCPRATLIDITHALPPHDILGAAYLLYAAWDYFPQHTVFVCVVDPGVGGERKELVALTDKKYIICPDNGIVSLLSRMKGPFPCHAVSREAVRAAGVKGAPDDTGASGARRISATFHGRDIFAPAAAMICNKRYGAVKQQEIDPYIIPDVYTEKTADPPGIKGKILHIDRFGNCISAIHRSEAGEKDYTAHVRLGAQHITLDAIHSTFSDVAPGRPLAYWGSTGFLEIGVRNGSAAAALGLALLDEVVLAPAGAPR
jgi:S-adenosylmethionine hydrolase